ncbi:MAG: glycosyltransferase family 4 protein [Desulfobacteraceae bacterium]|jgi:glycosyltransferase involved in cell wall biosynthesis
MRIIQITPGSGDNFYCENCLRDQTLVRALHSQGHEITMVPLYLPIKLDSPEVSMDTPIFFGGVNVYLQQKLELFRKTPRWVDSLFDNRALLSRVSKKAGMTSSRDLGETTLSMLRGEDGYQAKELDRLVDWLSRDMEKPDVIILSNILLGGLAATIKKHLQVPVVCLLQDEEAFVDGMGEPYSKEAWELLRKCSQEMDAFISVSKAYLNRIAPRLGLDENRIHTVYMGIELRDYMTAGPPPEKPTIGFLSRMCPQRGLDTLVDTFIILKQDPKLKECQLQICGGKSQSDEAFIRDMQHRLENAGAAGDVTFMPEFLGEGRRQWLKGLTVMCVPEKEEAAYGLFAMEAQAAGVPVVVPKIGIFPELIELTGGGELVEFNLPRFFAAVLSPLLLDPEAAYRMGQQGRRGIEEHFDVEKTAKNLIGVFEKVVKEA